MTLRWMTLLEIKERHAFETLESQQGFHWQIDQDVMNYFFREAFSHINNLLVQY